MKNTLYTVSKCKSDNTLYGTIHGSHHGVKTVCGKELDHTWYIVNNTFDGEITCKECLNKLENNHGLQVE